MKILGVFLVQQIRTGGHIRYLELMEALAEKHSVLIVFNPECGYRPKRFRTIDFRLRYSRGDPVPRSRKFAAIVRYAVKRGVMGNHHQPDAVLVFGESHLPAADILRKRYACPLVFAYRSASVRESLMKLREYRFRPLSALVEAARLAVNRIYEISVERSAAAIVFQSAADESDYLRRNSKAAGRTAVIRGDICQPRFREEHKLANAESSPNSLLFLGNLGERKGLRYLLRALAELRRRGFAPTLDILAAGEDFAPFAEYAAKNGIGDQIRYRGKVDDPFPFLISAGLLVVPSIFDSYPNAILEALHAGCPAIGAEVGGMPDMLGDPALVFAARDSRALARKLETLLSDPAAYSRLRELCRERREYFVFDWAAEWIREIGAILPAGGEA